MSSLEKDIAKITKLKRPKFKHSFKELLKEIPFEHDDLYETVSGLSKTYVGSAYPKLEELYNEIDAIYYENEDQSGVYSEESLDIEELIRVYREFLNEYIACSEASENLTIALKEFNDFKKNLEYLELLMKNYGMLQKLALNIESLLTYVDVDYDQELFWSTYIDYKRLLYEDNIEYDPMTTVSILIDYLFLDNLNSKKFLKFVDFLLTTLEPLAELESDFELIELGKSKIIEFEAQMLIEGIA